MPLPDTKSNFSEALGYNAEVKKRFDFKNVRAGFYVNGKKTVVEIKLSPEHLIENLQRDFEAGSEKVIIAVPNLRTIPSYQQKIQAHNKDLLNKVESKVLTEFFS